MRQQADKQTKSLFNGRVGYYNLKLKRKGFYTPPCPTLKAAPFCYTECMGVLFKKEQGEIEGTQIRRYVEAYWIISEQIRKEMEMPNIKSAGIESALKQLKDTFCKSFKRK